MNKALKTLALVVLSLAVFPVTAKADTSIERETWRKDRDMRVQVAFKTCLKAKVNRNQDRIGYCWYKSRSIA